MEEKKKWKKNKTRAKFNKLFLYVILDLFHIVGVW